MSVKLDHQTVREKHTLRTFKNKMLKKTFGPWTQSRGRNLKGGISVTFAKYSDGQIEENDMARDMGVEKCTHKDLVRKHEVRDHWEDLVIDGTYQNES